MAVDDNLRLGESLPVPVPYAKEKSLTVKNVQNRSYHDLGSYISASHSRGLLVAVPDESDEPVGHCQATIYDNETGWVTLFGIDVVSRTLVIC